MSDKKKFRRQPISQSHDDDLHSTSVTDTKSSEPVHPAESAPKLKKKTTKLSFADEEEDVDVSAFKKKSTARPDLQHRPSVTNSSREKASPPRVFSAAHSQQDNSRDALRELQMAMPKHRPPQQSSTEINDSPPNSPSSTPSIVIPTAASIREAKEKRERMRRLAEMQKADEESNVELSKRDRERLVMSGAVRKSEEKFIPLDEVEEQSESRVVREDDDDDIPEAFDDHEGSRISFYSKNSFGNKRSEIKKALSALEDDVVVVDNQSDGDDTPSTPIPAAEPRKGKKVRERTKKQKEVMTEEDKEWEVAQLSKVGMGTLIEKIPYRPISSGTPVQSTAAHIFDQLPTVESIEEAEKRIRTKLVEMKSVHNTHAQQLQELAEKLENSSEATVDFEKNLSTLNSKYMFFQKTRDTVLDLLDCLDAKVPEIDACSAKIRNVRQRRRRHQRRAFALAIKDEIDEFEALVSNSKPVVVEEEPGKGSGSDSEHSKSDPEDSAVDEFGRDKNYVKNTQRRQRMEERRKRIEKKKNVREESSDPTDAGMSSESEGGSDGEYWENAQIEALNASKNLMDEVDDEFKTVESIKTALEQWKRHYSDSYKQCFVSMCLPTLFSPYVKFELLAWDPFTTPTLDHFDWYQRLSDFGADENGEIPNDDEDFDLVPRLMQFITAPYLTQCVVDSFNPLSTQHNKNLLLLVSDLLIYVDANSNEFKTLLLEILQSFHRCLDNLPLPLPMCDQPNVLQFCRRCFGKSLKFLLNAVQWARLMSTKMIHSLTLEKLTSEKQIPFIKSLKSLDDSLYLLNKVLEAYPIEWLISPQADNIHSLLGNLCVQFTRRVTAGSALSSSDRTLALTLLRMYGRLNDTNKVKELQKMYAIQ
eukprot:c9867_g1_i1.p1 GENE.c9867_g1_i1~~c9867_g1_i1.p1  ORF type:complete len:873 (+),score=283.24 c9867_g1_i1:49-2667(+)